MDHRPWSLYGIPFHCVPHILQNPIGITFHQLIEQPQHGLDHPRVWRNLSRLPKCFDGLLIVGAGSPRPVSLVGASLGAGTAPLAFKITENGFRFETMMPLCLGVLLAIRRKSFALYEKIDRPCSLAFCSCSSSLALFVIHSLGVRVTSCPFEIKALKRAFLEASSSR